MSLTNSRPMASGGWELAGASVAGPHKREAGRCNQDSIRWKVSSDGAVAALADGHGAPRHARSGIGASIATEVACTVGIDHLNRRFDPSDLADRLVTSWRSAVDDHASTAGVGGSPLHGRDSYGTTLLVAIISPTTGCLLQIGDGDVVICSSDGRALRPVPRDRRLVGGRTTSLCSAGAIEDIRYVGIETPWPPRLLMLASDGYSTAFAESDGVDAAAADLATMVDERGMSDVHRRLKGWLTESAAASGDDASVVIAVPRPMGAVSRG